MGLYGDKVTGFTALSGERYITITRVNGASASLPLAAFHHHAKEAFDLLRKHGVIYVGKECGELIEIIAKHDEYPPRDVAERVGFAGVGRFATQDGRVISAEGLPPVEAIFPAVAKKCAVGGSHEKWLKKVAVPLKGQHVLQFGLIFMFAAPLLDLFKDWLGMGFEVVGEPRTGKSSTQRIASSAIGGIGSGSEGHYWVPFDSTLNGLEDVLLAHNHMPLLLDEANLFAMGDSERSRAAKFKHVAFKLSQGTVTKRWGVDETLESKIMYLTSSNKPLAEIIGEGADAEGALDRMLTIFLPKDRPHGALDNIPDGYDSEPQFLDAMMEAAGKHYGHAFPIFAQGLVNDRARSEKKLRKRVKKLIATFTARAYPPGHKVNQRVGNAFGLVYAAGVLAEEYGALPADYGCGAAVATCLRLHLGHSSARLPFRDRLLLLATSPAVVRINSRKPSKLSDEDIANGLFLNQGDKRTELLISTDVIAQIFPDWDVLRKRQEVRGLMTREEGHLATRRKLAKGRPGVRVHVFRIPTD